MLFGVLSLSIDYLRITHFEYICMPSFYICIVGGFSLKYLIFTDKTFGINTYASFFYIFVVIDGIEVGFIFEVCHNR